MTDQSRSIPWTVIGSLCLLTLVFILGSWTAGRSSGALESQRLSREVSSLQDQLASARMDNPGSSPQFRPATLDIASTRAELQRCQAESSQFRSKLEDSIAASSHEKDLAAAMLASGSKVQQLRGTSEGGAEAGYVIVVPPSKVIVFARLPQVEREHEFQVWAGDSETSVSSAGLILPKSDAPVYVEFQADPGAATAGTFAITEEPLGGSSQPSGPKVLTTSY